MRHLARMILLLLFLAPQVTVAAERAVFADGPSGVVREGAHHPVALGRKVYFMDGSVGYVRPDGIVLFEKEREEPAGSKVRVRLRPREKAEAEQPKSPEPDWYGLSKPTGKQGERLWLGAAELLNSGNKTGKLLTINDDGSMTTIQTYADGARLIDDPALPHLQRVLPDGTILVLKRSP